MGKISKTGVEHIGGGLVRRRNELRGRGALEKKKIKHRVEETV